MYIQGQISQISTELAQAVPISTMCVRAMKTLARLCPGTCLSERFQLPKVLSVKVRKTAKISNQYNQEPHLTQDTTWERDKKLQLDITNKSQEVSPFPAGDHKVAMNRRESMTNTRHN